MTYMMLSLLAIVASVAAEPVTRSVPPSPAEVYGELFEAVAMSGIYEPKDWVDLRPRRRPDEILQAYREIGPLEGAELLTFTQNYFAPPLSVGEAPELPVDRTLAEHIELLWPALTREAREGVAGGSLLALPNRYLVPGGRFREVYYWDSYFTLLGMDKRYDGLKRDIADNFASLIDRYGFVPNANRSYYLSRSQPPFFFLIVGLLDEKPEEAWADYLGPLKAEHAFWTAGAHGLQPGEERLRVARLADGTLLGRYWDAKDTPRDESYIYDVETAARADRPKAVVYRELRAAAESGWDFSSRWFADGENLRTIRTTTIAPVDLNSLLFGLEQAIAAGCREAGDEACTAEYAQLAEERAEAVRTKMWNEDAGHFADVDLRREEAMSQITAAMVYPLFFGIATEAQAEKTAAILRGALLAERGLLTTTQITGEQWDAPNGWAPMQWMAVQGLNRYGHKDLAYDLASRWVRTVARGFCESGKLVEKYDVVTAREGGGGEYPTQDGFGWTNGVTAALIAEYEGLEPFFSVRVAEEPGNCTRALADLP
jgi:alpha,alpha-trehalase